MIGRSLVLRQLTLLTINEHLKPWYVESNKTFIGFFSLETSVAETLCCFFFFFFLETTLYVVEVDF